MPLRTRLIVYALTALVCAPLIALDLYARSH